MKVLSLVLAMLVVGWASVCAQDTTTVATDSAAVTNFRDTIAVKPDTSYWQKSFSGGINYNQASFSNWVGGGVNSIALGSVVAARALYERGRWSWDNVADLQYGVVRQGGLTRKSADQIFLVSTAGYKIAPNWDLFMSGTFNTFFAPGYRYDRLQPALERLKISNFFAPAQLAVAWGIAYRPNESFSIRISPFAPRFTFVTDNDVRVRELADGTFIRDPTATAYGVLPGRTVRTEWLALQLQAALNYNLTSTINLNARYQLYANYETLDAIDHRLDLILTAKLNRYLSTTFGLIALYDEDFSGRLQLQQTLGVGLIYNVSTFRKKADK